MQYSNIKIEMKTPSYFVVIGDSERFGNGAVIAEHYSLEKSVAWLRSQQDIIRRYRDALPDSIKAENTPFVAYITDAYNQNKVHVFRHYSDGHYTRNQMICGRLFYGKFQRTTRKDFLACAIG